MSRRRIDHDAIQAEIAAAYRCALTDVDTQAPKKRKKYKDKWGPWRRKRRAALLARDGNLCVWCRQPFSDASPPTIEHLVPRALGGTDALVNLALACLSCNSHRGAQCCPGSEPG